MRKQKLKSRYEGSGGAQTKVEDRLRAILVKSRPRGTSVERGKGSGKRRRGENPDSRVRRKRPRKEGKSSKRGPESCVDIKKWKLDSPSRGAAAIIKKGLCNEVLSELSGR